MPEYINNKAFEKCIDKFQVAKRHRNKLAMIKEDIEISIKVIENRTGKTNNIDKLNDINDKLNKAELNFKIVQDEIALSFYKLSENIARYSKFDFIDVDDAIQEGVFICFDKIDRFNPIMGKAFNYLTTCIRHHLQQSYRSAKNYNELKKKYCNQIINDQIDQ